MASPTAVNDQITDSVSQANVKILAEAPAMAMGNLYQVTAQALGNAAHNATHSQQQANMISQAATTQGVSLLYTVDTAADSVATSKIFQSDLPELISLLKTVIEAFGDVKQ